MIGFLIQMLGDSDTNWNVPPKPQTPRGFPTHEFRLRTAVDQLLAHLEYSVVAHVTCIMPRHFSGKSAPRRRF